MNDRMLELYKRAHVPHVYIDPSNNMPVDSTIFSADKFAELIVKECLTKVREEIDTDYNWDLAGEILDERVLEHFGVK